MSIQMYSRKLRAAADALDALFEIKGTAKIAEKIRATLPKGRKPHWSRDPKNAARARAWRKTMAKAQLAAAQDRKRKRAA